MLKKLLFIPLIITSAFSQMISSNGATPLDLVQNTMVGYGIDIITVTSQGSAMAYGPFTGSGSTIGFEHGLVLTTGTAIWNNGPVGPNNAPNAGLDNGTGGYGLLSTIVSPTATFNATVFEITFKPSGDSIFFTYVFASEEYKEYVGAEFNDVFGFFLTGPNPSGPAYADNNLALIPGSSTPITINNVNHLTNSLYYVDNIAPTAGTYTQYDGYTVPLVARGVVVPDSTYILKIAIADAGDPIYDSGVFIKANSFSSGVYIGIEEIANEDFIVYPVPTDNLLHIKSAAGKIIESISMIDELGRAIFTKVIQSNVSTIDVSELAPGMYTIYINSIEGNFTKKISIQ